MSDQRTSERFWAKVVPTGFCWEWSAGLDPAGYGRFGLNRTAALAHRVSYELLVGPIADGLHIDHLCRNRKCVNPDHFDLVTNAENIRRGFGPNHYHALKSECPAGHPYSGDNLQMDGGRRRCRECRRIQRVAAKNRVQAMAA